jgi:hypothetical protein
MSTEYSCASYDYQNKGVISITGLSGCSNEAVCSLRGMS